MYDELHFKKLSSELVKDSNVVEDCGNQVEEK